MPLPKGAAFARGHSSKLLLGERMIFPGDFSQPAAGFVADWKGLYRRSATD